MILAAQTALSSIINMNMHTAISAGNKQERLPIGSQFKVSKYVYGKKALDILKHFKQTENLDESVLQKHFLHLINRDPEAVIYLVLLGTREAILEADAFDYPVEDNELKAAFQYMSENDVHNFSYVERMGYTAQYLNWKLLRHQEKEDLDNPLNFWLFKNAMYALFHSLGAC